MNQGNDITRQPSGDMQDTSAGAWDLSNAPSALQYAQARAKAGFQFDETPKEKAAREAKIAEDIRAAEEAGLQKEKLRRGLPLDDGDSAAGPLRQLINRTMADVRPRAIDWMWKGWIPKKYITLIVGETGAGKSTVLADIVARVTTGAPWPVRLIAVRPVACYGSAARTVRKT